MLDLGYSPEQAGKLFAILDCDNDGVLSLDDWTNKNVEGLSHLLASKMIRRELVGNNPLLAKRPPSSVRGMMPLHVLCGACSCCCYKACVLR